MELAVLASRPVVGSSRKSTGGSIISSMPIFVLFLSPPETPRILCVPICKTSQSEQAVNQVHTYELHTDCSNSLRLPLVDHTDHFIKRRLQPFIGGSVCTTSFHTYRSTKIHTPIDLISQTTFMLTVICSTQQESAMLELFGKRIQCNFMYSSYSLHPITTNLVNMISRH